MCHAGKQASPIFLLLAVDGGSISTDSGHVNCGTSGVKRRGGSGAQNHPEPIAETLLPLRDGA